MNETRDPYQPPDSRLEHGRGRPGSPVKAVLVALGVDIGGSLLAGMVLGLIHTIVLSASGASPAEIAAAYADVSAASPLFIVGSLTGFGFSVWGGYLCARIARSREFALGAVVASISTAVTSLLMAGDYAAGVTLAFSIATFGAVMFGVRFGVARNNAA